MRCNKVKKILGAYLDGELSENKAGKVKKHLEQCSACSWELKSFKDIDELGRRMIETSSPKMPEGYWENYLAHLHQRLGQEEIHQQSNTGNLFNRFFPFPLAFAVDWFKNIAPVFVSVVIIALLTIGISYLYHQPSQTAITESSKGEKVTINFYLKEHEHAVMQVERSDICAKPSRVSGPRIGADYSTQPSQRGIELGYEDVFYYDSVRGMDEESLRERGVFLRAPHHSSVPARRKPSRLTDITNGHNLNIQKAQESVRFRIVAPQMLNPGYFLENIRKVEGKDCIQLIYSNGISTLSLFEQALESKEKLHSGDFREYVMYSEGNGASVNIIGWNSAEVSFTLIGEEDLSHLMSIIRAIQENYLMDSKLSNEM